MKVLCNKALKEKTKMKKTEYLYICPITQKCFTG